MIRTIVAVLLLAGTLAAQTTPTSSKAKDGAILSRTSFVLPAYDAVEETAKYAEPDEYADAVADKNYKLERLEYASDGLTVSAYLYGPANPKQKQPVIAFIRGSYIVNDQGPALLTLFRRLAQQGFVVIAPMLRGSDGTQGRDEMGGNDLHDIANAFTVIQQLDFADSSNVFMYGESRGGIMTLLSIKAGMPIKAAATFGAITDLGAYLQLRKWDASLATKIWPDFEQNKAEILRSRSAQQWPDQITVPILLMHGAKDPQVPPQQTLKFAEQLATAGKNYGVIVFPGDNHILAHHRNERDRMVSEWFRSFISAPSQN